MSSWKSESETQLEENLGFMSNCGQTEPRPYLSRSIFKSVWATLFSDICIENGNSGRCWVYPLQKQDTSEDWREEILWLAYEQRAFGREKSGQASAALSWMHIYNWPFNRLVHHAYKHKSSISRSRRKKSDILVRGWNRKTLVNSRAALAAWGHRLQPVRDIN